MEKLQCKVFTVKMRSKQNLVYCLLSHTVNWPTMTMKSLPIKVLGIVVISGLKVDESAVSPTCKIKQLTITHVADSNEGKAFCDQEKKDKVVPKRKSEQVQHENIMPPSPSNTNRRDVE